VCLSVRVCVRVRACVCVCVVKVFVEEDARRAQDNGTIQEFILDSELKRRAAQGEFGDLFVMVLFMIAERNAWSTVTWPLIPAKVVQLTCFEETTNWNAH